MKVVIIYQLLKILKQY